MSFLTEARRYDAELMYPKLDLNPHANALVTRTTVVGKFVSDGVLVLGGTTPSKLWEHRATLSIQNPTILPSEPASGEIDTHG